jgi:hypothetical protein
MTPTPGQPSELLALLRHDPAHVNELALLWALPRVGPGVARWHTKEGGRPIADQERRWEKRTIRSATGNARWGGAIMGSSFYVGMPAALAMIYCEQLGAILRVAAIHGRNPMAPERAAEILVIQGRYPTVAQATIALREATLARAGVPALTFTERLGQLLHSLPSMVGLQMRRMKNPLDIVIGAIEAASLFVPVISIPAWAYANGRATSRLGKKAVSFYAEPPDAAPQPEPTFLLGPPTARRRRNFVVNVVAVWLALAALAAIIPLGRYAHALPLAGKLLAEVGLIVAFSKIILATRPFGHLAADPATPLDPGTPVHDL